MRNFNSAPKRKNRHDESSMYLPKKRDQKKEEDCSMAARGKKRKKAAPKTASNSLPNSYAILLSELAARDRTIAQRSAIEALERNQK